MKNYTKAGISLVLVITFLILSLFSQGNAIKVGEGKGTNAKILNLENTLELLNDLSKHNVFSEQIANDDSSEAETKYSSFTLEACGYLTFSIRNRNDTYEMKMNVNNKYYFTETADYYEVEGTIVYSSKTTVEDPESRSNSQVENNSVIKIAAAVYIDQEGVWMKIDKFDMTTLNEEESYDGEIDDMFGKWYKIVEGSYYEDLYLQLPDLSRFNFEHIIKLISDAVNGEAISGFKKNKDTYTLNIKDDNKDDNDTELTDLVIDLSSPAIPVFEWNYKYRLEDTANNYYANQYQHLLQKYKNINNTVIDSKSVQKMKENAEYLPI